MILHPANLQHRGSRKEQQDSFGFSDISDIFFASHAGTLVVVADGMGGLAEGATASRLAVTFFMEAYSRKTPDESIEEALERSLGEANRVVHDFAVEKHQEDNCGTTLVAAVVHDSGLYWTYAGDSRLYLTDGQALQLLTEDQIYACQLDRAAEKGIIDYSVARNHPQRDALISYIGDIRIRLIGKGSLPGRPHAGMTLLLCSDGLYKSLSEEEMLNVYDQNPEKWVQVLMEKVLEKQISFQDNITMACLGVRNSCSGALYTHPEATL